MVVTGWCIVPVWHLPFFCCSCTSFLGEVNFFWVSLHLFFIYIFFYIKVLCENVLFQFGYQGIGNINQNWYYCEFCDCAFFSTPYIVNNVIVTWYFVKKDLWKTLFSIKKKMTFNFVFLAHVQVWQGVIVFVYIT